MKYIVKKMIPLATGVLRRGVIIDSSEIKYSFLDFKLIDFFEPYKESVHKLDDEVIYRKYKHQSFEVYKVVEILLNGNI